MISIASCLTYAYVTVDKKTKGSGDKVCVLRITEALITISFMVYNCIFGAVSPQSHMNENLVSKRSIKHLPGHIAGTEQLEFSIN